MEDAAGARKRKRDAGEEVAATGPEVVSRLESKELQGLGEGEEAQEEYEGIAEESVEEVMRWLEAEISGSSGKGGAGDDSSDHCGFVTINGNEESCGPSFSAAACTVMASVDTRAGAPPPPTPIPWPWPEPEPDTALNEDDQAKEKAKADDGLDEEEWLLDLLAAGGQALDGFSLD